MKVPALFRFVFYPVEKKQGGVAASTLQCESFYDAAVS